MIFGRINDSPPLAQALPPPVSTSGAPPKPVLSKPT
jgi:hypothetical protein